MQQFTMINGIPIRYAIEGNGERNFLILHGFIESIEIFESFVSKLAKKGKVLIFDMPGCGLSGYDGRETLTMDYMAEIAYELIEKTKFDKITVIGHSMGGYIALSLAEKHDNIIEKIVLLHSTPFAATEKRKKEREEDLEIVVSGKKEKLIEINSKWRFAKENWKKFSDDIMDMAEAVEMSDDNAVAAQLRGLIERKSHEEYFRTTSKPKMMIYGREDSYISNERAEEVSQMFQTAETLWLEHSGHMGFIEEPEKIIDRI